MVLLSKNWFCQLPALGMIGCAKQNLALSSSSSGKDCFFEGELIGLNPSHFLIKSLLKSMENAAGASWANSFKLPLVFSCSGFCVGYVCQATLEDCAEGCSAHGTQAMCERCVCVCACARVEITAPEVLFWIPEDNQESQESYGLPRKM